MAELRPVQIHPRPFWILKLNATLW